MSVTLKRYRRPSEEEARRDIRRESDKMRLEALGRAKLALSIQLNRLEQHLEDGAARGKK